MSTDATRSGPGFLLRPAQLGDAEPLRRLADDPEVARYTSHRFPHPFRAADAARYLAQYLAERSGFTRVIEIDGSFAGALFVHPGEGIEAHSAELGYWLGRAYWGRGIMTAAVGIFVPWAMQECRLSRVLARVTAGNLASMRLLERNGFQLEGVMRRAVQKHGVLSDSHLFARLAELS